MTGSKDLKKALPDASCCHLFLVKLELLHLVHEAKHLFDLWVLKEGLFQLILLLIEVELDLHVLK